MRTQFGEIYTDFYLHLMQHGLRYESDADRMLKDGLAALTLHLASRPRAEATAWTLNFQNPLLNLFVTGSSRFGNVTGRAFSEGVKKGETNQFFSQVTEEGREPRQSAIEFEGANVFSAVEDFYRNSEQRPARYFQLGDEDFLMLSAQPDCDMSWFHGLDADAVSRFEQEEELSLLETREYRFDCGCSIDRIYPIIAALSAETALGLFEKDGTASAHCPRCGAAFQMTRDGFEAYLAKSADD